MSRSMQSEDGLAADPVCLDAIVVSENREAPGISNRPKDEFSKFLFVVSGTARWVCDRRRYMLGPTTLCHLPAGLEVHQEVMPNQEVLAYTIRYRPELLSPSLVSQLAAFGFIPMDLGCTTINQARLVRSIFQEMLFEQDSRQEGWEMILRSRLIDLAVRTLRLARRKWGKSQSAFQPGSDSTDRVALYASRLKSQFFRQETLADAARSVGLGGRQFTEVFRKVTGQSWRQYILDLRVKHAATLLCETDRSVSAVAFEAGFENLSNFHHLFKSEYDCSPLTYRQKHSVQLPAPAVVEAEPGPAQTPGQGFRFRGMKGWSWTPEQYLEEIPVLRTLGMNFLMNCYRSMSVSRPGEPWRNEWWRPMSRERREDFIRIIRGCAENGITFCLALHPQLAASRPLVHGSAKDLELFFQHYAWAQEQGVEWFAVCLDDTSWGAEGPGALGASHSALVNVVFDGLYAKNNRSRMILCPAVFWGDGTNPEHSAYLAALAQDLHPDVCVFWNGDGIVTPRITRVAAQGFRKAVGHPLFLWDNYPVNDGSPTMHLGPLSGRDPDLCEVIEGYITNPMCSQSRINRLPLATAAEYSRAPQTYKPARAIAQAIARLAKTPQPQSVLKQLVAAYPGFILAGGGTGTNPVRARFADKLAADDSRRMASTYAHEIEALAEGLGKYFGREFPDAKHTVLADVAWMKQQLPADPRRG